MREIKFRAQKSNPGGSRGVWVYGYHFVTHERPDRSEHWIITPDFPQAQHLVYSETVGEFCGLLDKNGKEIYEGDIVKGYYDTSSIGVVRFGSYMAGGLDFYAAYAYGFYMQRHPEREDDTEALSERNEIIGNIYENPELLKNE